VLNCEMWISRVILLLSSIIKVSVVELSCTEKGKERGWVIMGHSEGLGSNPAAKG
jgi:hypothetical protein